MTFKRNPGREMGPTQAYQMAQGEHGPLLRLIDEPGGCANGLPLGSEMSIKT